MKKEYKISKIISKEIKMKNTKMKKYNNNEKYKKK